MFNTLNLNGEYNVIMVDECQFATEDQINQLKILSQNYPVLCYGLLTDFQTKLFDYYFHHTDLLMTESS